MQSFESKSKKDKNPHTSQKRSVESVVASNIGDSSKSKILIQEFNKVFTDRVSVRKYKPYHGKNYVTNVFGDEGHNK